MKKHIPNLITLANLFSGCVAMVQIYEGNLAMGSYWILLGAVFDFFDGMVARWLEVSSPIGKDLDSLADVVTFGCAPGAIMFVLLKFVTDYPYVPYLAFIIPLAAAYRLAKFNHDSRQTQHFYGLPTPAAALFFCSFPLIINADKSWAGSAFFEVQWLLIILAVISYLMLSDIRLFSLKVSSFNLSAYRFPILFIVLSNLLFFVLFFKAIPLIIILYVVLSVVKNVIENHEIQSRNYGNAS